MAWIQSMRIIGVSFDGLDGLFRGIRSDCTKRWCLAQSISYAPFWGGFCGRSGVNNQECCFSYRGSVYYWMSRSREQTLG